MKRKLATMALLLAALSLQAQTYCGQHKYDGEHKNELTSYAMVGGNVVTGAFGGLSVAYQRHFTDRWHAGGDVQAQFGKQLYSTRLHGGYRVPIAWSDLYIDGQFIYNRYNRWNTNETITNISVCWETPYFDLRIGESYIHYQMLKSGYSEPLTLTFGTGVNIRPRWSSWNIGLFFRNYDHFYYENWNINWGVRFNASLAKQAKLFGEFNVRPAGSMSQLASKYETSMKLGIKYVW